MKVIFGKSLLVLRYVLIAFVRFEICFNFFTEIVAFYRFIVSIRESCPFVHTTERSCCELNDVRSLKIVIRCRYRWHCWISWRLVEWN